MLKKKKRLKVNASNFLYPQNFETSNILKRKVGWENKEHDRIANLNY